MGTLKCYYYFLTVTIIFTVIFLGVSSTVLHAQGYVSASDQAGCGTHVGQDWYLRNNSRPYIQVSGTIAKKVKINEDSFDPENFIGIFDDGDWNICLKPAPGEEYVLVNSIGKVNKASGLCNDDGLIELEVRAGPDFLVSLGPVPIDLPSIFPIGTEVTTYGQWVEDSGHDRKTELHPLQWMASRNMNPTWIWVSQDNTARFATPLNWGWFDLPLPIENTFVRPGAVPQSTTQIIHEQSRLHMDLGQSADATQAMASIGLDHVVRLKVQLDKGPFFDCEFAGGGQIITEGSNYLGRFELSSAPLLKDTISATVFKAHDVDTNTDYKTVRIDVAAELNSPPQGPLVYSKWRYDMGPGVAKTETITIESPSPHRRQFAWTYAPSQGPNWGKTSWSLDVVGATQPEDDSPKFEKPYQRTFIGERRIYQIVPSMISLVRYDKGSSTDINIDDSKLFPGVALTTLNWTIEIKRNSVGIVPNPPKIFQVTPSTPTTIKGFSAQLLEFNHPIYHQLRIDWDSCPNRTQLTATAVGETELGENVSYALLVESPCGFSRFSYAEVREYFNRLISHRFGSKELYKVIRTASPEDQKWLIAFGRWEKGKDLTPKEVQLILEKATEGKSLPPVVKRKAVKRKLSMGTPVTIPLLGKDEMLQQGNDRILERIYFESNEAAFDQGSILALRRAVAILKMNPKVNVEIAGYTDNTGSKSGNFRLSESRAQKIKSFLVTAGIDLSRLSVNGYGELYPIESNDTEEGRAVNRRVEIHVH